MEKKYRKPEKNIYQIVSERIIRQLEDGDIPWRKPWCRPGSTGMVNYVSRKPYHGINLLLLKEEGEYLTFKQCEAAGGRIRKGEKSTPIFKWIPFVPKDKKEEKERLEKEGKDWSHLLEFYAGWDNVFHISQTEGIASRNETCEHKEAENPTDMATFHIDRYSEVSGVKIDARQCDHCSYDAETDTVTVPVLEQFTYTEEWYGRVFDGLVRSTVAESRCNRKAGKDEEHFDVKEDLVAEIGSSMLLNENCLPHKEAEANTLAACRKWIGVFRNDIRVLVSACRQAEAAARYIIDPSRRV